MPIAQIELGKFQHYFMLHKTPKKGRFAGIPVCSVSDLAKSAIIFSYSAPIRKVVCKLYVYNIIYDTVAAQHSYLVLGT